MSTKLGKPAWGQKLAQVRYSRNVTCDGPHELEGGGVSEHCLICPSGMLPPKLRHISGSLAFSEKISVKNVPYPGQITF